MAYARNQNTMRYKIHDQTEETYCDTCGCPMYAGDWGYESANEDAVFCSPGCRQPYERRERASERREDRTKRAAELGIEEHNLFPYRCSFPSCVRQVGFAARRCPEHDTPETCQSNLRRFVQADPEEMRQDPEDRRPYPWV
jgi:hypothetical protein